MLNIEDHTQLNAKAKHVKKNLHLQSCLIIFLLVFISCNKQTSSPIKQENLLQPSAFISAQIETLRQNPLATSARLKKLRDSLQLKSPAIDWIALELWEAEWLNIGPGEHGTALKKLDTLEKVCSEIDSLSNHVRENLMLLKGRTLSLGTQVNKAVRKLLEARDFSLAVGDTISYIRALVDLGWLYTYNDNQVKAYKTFRQAEDIIYNHFGTRRMPPDAIAWLHNRLAAVCYFKWALKQGGIIVNGDSVDRHSYLAIKWALLGNCRNILGSSYNELGLKMDWPNHYLQMADSLFRLTGNIKERCLANFNHYLKLSRNNHKIEGEVYLDTCMNLFKGDTWPYVTRMVYEYKASYCDRRGQHNSANVYRLKSNNSQLAEIEFAKRASVSDQEAKYELDKKNELIIKQEASIQFQQSRKRAYLFFSLITGSLLLGLVFLFFRLHRSGKRIQIQKQQLEKTNSKLSSELSKNETLLAEVHHRVKNNLQIIISLLDLQMRQAVTEKEKKQFINATNRIRSIALVHNMLYNRSEMQHIQFREYASELIGTLSSVIADEREWDYTIESSNIVFNLDILIPLGIFLDEAITNSFKYGFISNKPLHITIQLEQEKEGYCLHYADNGQGFPDGFAETKTNSIGLYLLRTMTRQLGGTLKMFTKNGATIELYFTNTFETNSEQTKSN